MITAFQTQSSMKTIATRFLMRALAIGGAIIPTITCAQVDKPVVMDKVTVSETKTHTLFMGADISVNLDKDLYPVRGVIGSSFVIDINGEEKIVSARQAPLNLKITPNLKLTDVSATIAGYKRVQAYSFNNDPSVQLTRGLSKTATTNADLQAVANDAQSIADTASNKALGNAALFASADSPLATGSLKIEDAAIQAAGLKGTTIFQQGADASANQTQNGDEPGGRLVTTGLDAMDVEFDISSSRPLQKPYVITITRFHPKGTKPGTVQDLVYAKELHIQPIFISSRVGFRTTSNWSIFSSTSTTGEKRWRQRFLPKE
jgi:hypothetical protein